MASWHEKIEISSMTTAQKLEAVQKIVRATIKLYRNPWKWIQSSWAGMRDKTMAPVTPKKGSYAARPVTADDADCFCLVGALRKTGFELYGNDDIGFLAAEYVGDIIQHRNTKLYKTGSASGRLDVCTGWNDNKRRTFADVLKMLRRSRDEFKPVFNMERGVIDAQKV